MNIKLFICGSLLLLALYVFISIPYCKIIGDQTSFQETIDKHTTAEEISEMKTFPVMLLYTRGESMLPAIKSDSECLCIRKKAYNVGDIVLFFAEIEGKRTGVSHRIFSIEGEHIFTKGDNNEWVDSPITEENIVCTIPEVPRFITWIQLKNFQIIP